MPRPANPGWSPKTIKLSNEVIEAVWVQAAREGKTPGRLINDILARAMLQPTTLADEPTGLQVSTAPPATEQQATGESVYVATEMLSPKPAETPIKESIPTNSEESIDPEHVTLVGMLNEPHKHRLGNRILFFQELSQRYGQEIDFREFFRWREQSRIPAHLFPFVKALIEEKGRAKRFKRVSSGG